MIDIYRERVIERKRDEEPNCFVFGNGVEKQCTKK
jgi:hypothetical protein